MNVEWNWIKQRPHFIAEGLNEHYDLTVVYQYRYGRKILQKRQDEGIKLIPLKTIPKISGSERLKIINDTLMALMVKKIIKKLKPDIVFTTYPLHIDMIPAEFDGKIYYDCMDYHIAFAHNDAYKKRLALKEKCLLDRADKVFVSSEYIQDVVSHNNEEVRKKTVLIRNAYDGNIISVKEYENNNNTFKLAYIGTISSWFDWKTITEAVQKRDNIEVHLFGPIDLTEIPCSDRIKYHGVIEHNKLYDVVKDMDCLIMPFVLNEIVKAVDPVKIYEYINFNKNVLIREYNEVERLKEYVYFYNNADEFINAIDLMQKNNALKYSMKARIDFLAKNSWKNRVDRIVEVLSE